MQRLHAPKPVAWGVAAVVWVAVSFAQGLVTTDHSAGSLIVASLENGVIMLAVVGALRIWQRRNSLL